MVSADMENITIRKAGLNDVECLLVFEQQLIEAERPFNPTLKSSGVKYYDLEAMIASDHVEIVVAEWNGKVIGSGYARIEEAKPNFLHLHYAYLGFMYVDPEYRGMGINKKVMDHLISWAVSRNMTEFRLDVYETNAAAISAYEKVGFTKLMVQMRMELKAEM